MLDFLEKYFSLKQNNTDVKTEVLAGITTFLTMAYIIVVNPMILSNAGMPFNAVLFATVLVSSLSCILMGLYANLPFALAPGMGINAFFTYFICLNLKVEWQTALGAVFVSGIIFFILSITKLRTIIVKAIPQSIRYAVAAGIGLFLTFIGLQSVNFITDNPATLVGFGGFNLVTGLFVFGVVLTALLLIMRVRGHLIISIIIMSLIALFFSILGTSMGWIKEPLVQLPKKIIELPSLAVFFKLDLSKVLTASMIGPIFALIFTDMFDSISTFVGVATTAGLVDEKGDPIHVRKALLVDAVATVFSGLFGTSSATTYIESSSGVEEGGRTGLTAIVAGLLFLPFMFFAPLLSFIPALATAPILVVLGVFMMKPLMNLDWKDYEESLPAFFALVLIPLTYSITQGILWGFLMYSFVKIFRGKYRQISLTLYIIDIFAIIGLVLGYLG